MTLSPSTPPLPKPISQTALPSTGPSSYAFTFVCQKGVLEGLSLLLVASLKRFLRCQYELIAAVPRPGGKRGDLSPVTYRLLQDMGVRIEYFDNPILGDRLGDLLTNKIYCFQIPTEMEKTVFLDSDLLCLKDFVGNRRFSAPFNAAPTFLATGRNWEQVYAAVGLSVPETNMSPLFSDDLQPPYFNSGFVAVDTELAPILFDTWLSCFNQINEAKAMEDNLYFREQVSLALAVIKMGLDYDTLDKNYNFWVKAHPLNDQELPYFLHHTWPNPPLYHQPHLIELVRSLVADYPEMKPLVAKTRWKYYLRPDWLTAINQRIFQQRPALRKLLGKSVADAIVAA
ncbi:MAG: hypothetical protein AAF635_08950 [Cyanobacteria bacterium P01_C01_bin.69]